LMLKLIMKLRDTPLPEKKVEQLKIYHKQAVGIMLEVPYQTATWLASNVFRGGKVDFESYVSDIDAVSPETIKNAAKQFLTPSRMALSVAGSPPDDESLTNILRKEAE